jgi:hypothetical protein
VPEPRSPEWWVDRLNPKLDAQAKRFHFFDDYYRGEHPLPNVPERAKGAFRRWLKLSRANMCGLVVDSMVERLVVQGIRYGQDQTADEEAWRLWQANHFDTASRSVFLEAAICGESAVSVAPNPADERTPLILPEHPTQMVVETSTSSAFDRRAAFKKWVDDSERVFATLYLPDVLVKLQSKQKKVKEGEKIAWERREVDGEQYPLPNPLGSVPVVPFRNRPRQLTGGVSELDDVTDSQDRINDTLFMRHMAIQYSAFRQRWAVGLPLETDPDTGLPKSPFKPSQEELFVSENPETKFGEFGETTLTGYLGAVAADIQHIAAVTRTPPHYLLGEMVNLAAEALKAAEAGLVSKVRDASVDHGESLEEVDRLAFVLLGDAKRADVIDAEIIWRNPEFRSDAALADATVKLYQAGLLSRQQAQERIGMTPQEIARTDADQLFAGLLEGEEPDVA